MIDQTPGDLAGAGWQLAGPGNETGSGNAVLTDMAVGTYTLAWTAVGGYMALPSEEKTLAAGDTITFVGAHYALVPAATFTMGSPPEEYERLEEEVQHTVTLTTPLYMSTTEVTNRQYAELAQWAYDNGHCTASETSLADALDGSVQELYDLDGSHSEVNFDGDTFDVEAGKGAYPVGELTWYGAVAYCDWLSLKNGLPRAYDHATWRCNDNDPYNAQGYRLPTEAEWEYACRAGTDTPFNTGDCIDSETEANVPGGVPYTGCPAGESAFWTVAVCSYPGNAFGLFDMHGNVQEWCNDWYADYGGDTTNPAGPASGDGRVMRGGAFAT